MYEVQQRRGRLGLQQMPQQIIDKLDKLCTCLDITSITRLELHSRFPSQNYSEIMVKSFFFLQWFSQ